MASERSSILASTLLGLGYGTPPYPQSAHPWRERQLVQRMSPNTLPQLETCGKLVQRTRAKMLQPAVALFVVGMFMCTSPQAEGASTGISLAPASVRNEDETVMATLPAVAPPRGLNGSGSAAGRAPDAAPSTLPRQESGSAVNPTPQTRTGRGSRPFWFATQKYAFEARPICFCVAPTGRS